PRSCSASSLPSSSAATTASPTTSSAAPSWASPTTSCSRPSPSASWSAAPSSSPTSAAPSPPSTSSGPRAAERPRGRPPRPCPRRPPRRCAGGARRAHAAPPAWTTGPPRPASRSARAHASVAAEPHAGRRPGPHAILAGSAKILVDRDLCAPRNRCVRRRVCLGRFTFDIGTSQPYIMAIYGHDRGRYERGTGLRPARPEGPPHLREEQREADPFRPRCFFALPPIQDVSSYVSELPRFGLLRPIPLRCREIPAH